MKAGRRFVAAAAALLALAALAACNGDDATLADPPETVRTEPPQATTTTTDPYAVPAVIDVAYVNRVLAGLDAAHGEIVRILIRTKTLPPEAIDRLKALYGNRERLQLQIDILQELVESGMPGYRTDAGDVTTRVSELITTTPQCIYARVSRDYANVFSSQWDPRFGTQWVALTPLTDATLGRYNQTRWTFIYEGFQRDFTAPRTNPCSPT